MSKSHYAKVKELANSGRLRLIGIMSPSRVGSTILARSLSSAPEIGSWLNQPFHLTYSHPYQRPIGREEIAYGRILEAFNKARSGNPVILIVKLMVRNLGIGDQFERFYDLCASRIFLIRNPVLSIASLLRAQVKVMEDMPEASPTDFDVFAEQAGYRAVDGRHWRLMRDAVIRSEDYRQLDDLLIETLSFIDLNRHEPRMLTDYVTAFRDRDARRIGQPDLDSLAASHGFATWSAMVDHGLRGETFQLFSALLEPVFAVGWSGWGNMSLILERFLAGRTDYHVVDSTLLRMQPEYLFRALSNQLGISEIESGNLMPKPVAMTEKETFAVNWMSESFKRASGSKTIRPPLEMPIGLNAFPAIFKKHLLETALPTWIALLGNPATLRPHDDELDALLTTLLGGKGCIAEIDPIFAYSLLLTGSRDGTSLATELDRRGMTDYRRTLESAIRSGARGSCF